MNNEIKKVYKICFITTISMTLNAFVRQLAEYLHKTGCFEIYFICDEDKEFTDSLPSYINYIPVAMERGISLGGIKAMLQLRTIFKQHNFDLIQYSTPNASCYAAIAGYLAKVPVRLYCQWGIAYVGFEGLKRTVFKMIEKMVCSLSTWVEPDSHSNLEFCHNEGIYPVTKGSVVWNGSASGVNLNKFDINNKAEWNQLIRNKYNIPMEATVFTFVGRITKDKGINELLAAFKNIKEKYNNKKTYLVLVGNDELGDGVDNELYEWSLSQNCIIYTGFTNEVEKYLAAADVYVLPSYREGFGSSVIEAEAMGVPVIVTNIPGPVNAMIKDKTGLVVQKKSVEELISAMCLFTDSQNLCGNMGSEAYKFATTNFNQEVLFEKIVVDRIELMNRNE